MDNINSDISTENQCFLYLVLSQTGSIVSRLLKIITGAHYNHSSVSLDKELQTMYSFGRLNAYNPFFGGFVMESPNYGTFKRFSQTDIVVLRFCISEEQWSKIADFLNGMYRKKEKYRYNYLGLFLAALHIVHRGKDRYYCSEFARKILTGFGIVREGNLPDITKPIDFLKLNCAEVVYCGKLNAYERYIADAVSHTKLHS